MNHLFYLALVIRITYSNHLISNTFCDFQQTLFSACPYSQCLVQNVREQGFRSVENQGVYFCK